MSKRHKSGAYHRPNPKGMLSYLVECVEIWCDWFETGDTFLSRPEHLHSIEKTCRDAAIEKYGADNPAVDALVKAEVEACIGYVETKRLTNELAAARRGKISASNRRSRTPSHMPLRPHRTIVTLLLRHLIATRPSLSENAARDLCAKMLNDGIPKSEAGGRLAGYNIRSAYESYYAVGTDLIGAMILAERNAAAWGGSNLWDRGVIEHLLWARRENPSGNEAVTARLFEFAFKQTFRPLQAFARIYTVARQEDRFRKLAGCDLARAIDAAYGLGQLTERCLAADTLGKAKAEIGSVFADAAV